MKPKLNMKLERVFVTQDVSDARTIDFSDAEQYGELVDVLGSDKELIYNPRESLRVAEKVLKDFSDDDYLLAVGDPVAIVLVAAVALKNNNGKMKMLRWDKKESRYIQVRIDTR